MDQSNFNAEVASLMLRMRILIRKEFGETLSLQAADAETRFCDYGFRSQQPELLQLTRELALLASVPIPENLSGKNKSGENSILELLNSDLVNQPVKIRCSGIPTFVIAKRHGYCLLSSSFQELKPLRNIDLNQVHFDSATDVDVYAFSKQSNQMPFDEFMWFCGKRLSNGNLLSGIKAYRAFALNRWPDFGNLIHDNTDVRLAGALMRRSYSLSDLLNVVNVSQEKAIEFLNACMLCGWLRESNPTVPLRASGSNSNRLNIINRIRVKLGIQQ